MLNVTTFALLLLSQTDLSTTDALKKEFFTQAPIGWAQLANDDEQIAGRLHYRVVISDNGVPRSEPQIDKMNSFKINNAHVSLTTNVPSGEAENVVVAGPKYGFKVARGLKEQNYKLQSLVFIEPEISSLTIRQGSFLWHNLKIPRVCWNVPLEELIVEPGFVPKKLLSDGAGVDRLVTMDFECQSDKYHLTLSHGTMSFRPSENWAIQTAKFDLRPDWTVVFNNKYRRSRDGKIRLARSDYFYHFSKDKIDEHHEVLFEELEGRVVPDSDFQLNAFGLPEPVEPKRSQVESKIHYWLIAGAAFLFSAAMLLRHFSK